jgi:hypothetical protein
MEAVNFVRYPPKTEILRVDIHFAEEGLMLACKIS